MNILVINTANDDLCMVLKTETKTFLEVSESKMHHNEAMIPLLDKVLNSANLQISDIDEFGVVIGPGSFTGIRVGISTIKAFRDSLNVKAKGINNLKLLFDLSRNQNPDIETVAILGSRNSYFVGKLIGEEFYIYERNLTLEELLEVANNKQIGVFKADDNLNCFVVNLDADVLIDCCLKSGDETLVPVYYQLSQAENEKLKNGKVEIVEATEQDLFEVASIEKESIQTNTLSLNNITEMFNNENYKIFVCKFNDEVAGFIILQKTDEVSVVSVAVKKDMRNLGIATKLFKHTFEYSSKIGCETVSLEVSKKNLTASLLYQKLGFSTRRIRKNYYSDGSDAIEMFKQLN